MKRYFCLSVTVFAASLFFLGWLPLADAGPLDVGGTYTVQGTNFPINFGPTNVILDSASHSLAGGQLNLQASITNVDANTQWVDFAFSTPNGAIAGDLTKRWDFTISNIPLSEPSYFKGMFYYWSANGTALTDIKNWAGGGLFPPDGTNPIDPSKGKGYGGYATPPGDPPFNPSLFISPFSFISTSTTAPNFTPSSVNDFHVAILVGAVAEVPEPASLAVWGAVGLLGLVVSRRRSPASARPTSL